jgi:hypothetical protein
MAWCEEHEMKIGPSKGDEGIPLDQQWWLGNPMGDVPTKTVSCPNCSKNIEISLKAAMRFGSILCRDCNPDFVNSKCNPKFRGKNNG